LEVLPTLELNSELETVMLRSFAGTVAVVGSVLSIAACSSDPLSPATQAALPRLTAGPTADVGPVVLSYKSGVNATEFCSQTAANTFNSAPGSCTASIVAPITTVNPGWTASIPGASWISATASGDAYLSNPASYTYRKSFTVAAGAASPVLNLTMAADNGVTVYLNNVQIGATAVGQNIFATPQQYSANSGFNIGGNNDLVFVVENTRVPTVGTNTPTPLGVACPTRPHATSTTGGAFYDAGGYDAVLCNNPTGVLYSVTVSWNTPVVQIGGQGCSPGYWKNHNFPTGFSKDQLFNTIFENAFPGLSLQQVLSQGGGGIKALGRHTVSAYFNAVSLGTNYELTPAQVVAKFNAAFPSGDIEGTSNYFESLEDVNGRVCPNPTGR